MINHDKHNTKCVTGHFHMYMGLGVIAMIFGFMYYLAKNEVGLKPNTLERIAYVMYVTSILGINFGFLTSGLLSTPRKFEEYLAECQAPDIFEGIDGILLISSIPAFFLRLF